MIEETTFAPIAAHFDALPLPDTLIAAEYADRQNYEFVDDIRQYYQLREGWRSIDVDYLLSCGVYFGILTPYAYFYMLPIQLACDRQDHAMTQCIDYVDILHKRFQRNDAYAKRVLGYFDDTLFDLLLAHIECARKNASEDQILIDNLVTQVQNLQMSGADK